MNTAKPVPQWTAMLTLHLILFATACGPTIDIYVGGDDESGPNDPPSETSTEGDSWSTDPSAMGDTSSGSSVGSRSSSSGDGMGSSSTGGESSGTTGGSCVPSLQPVGTTGLMRCECDGLSVDPALCGCARVDEQCKCDGVLLEDVTCEWPCHVVGPNDCACGAEMLPAPFAFCWCGNADPPQYCDA